MRRLSSSTSGYAQQIVDACKIVDGYALNERKLWHPGDFSHVGTWLCGGCREHGRRSAAKTSSSSGRHT